MGGFTLPIGVGLQASIWSGRTRVPIVYEDHAVTDEYVVFDSDTFAYEGVAGYFAATAYPSTTLNFHERSDLNVVPYFTAV
jgi:hypothetical protein